MQLAFLIVPSLFFFAHFCSAQPFFHLVGPSSLFGLNSGINAIECKKFFENVTDVESLNHHEFAVFEHCVFYFLANRAQQQVGSQGFHFGASIHPIASMPPTYNDLRLSVSKITIQHFHLNEFMRDLNIAGYLELRWHDERLTWDSQQFKVQQIKIASANHLWVPFLTGQGYETALRNDYENMEVRRVDVRNSGNVTAILGFKFTTFCDDTDFKHFPDDIYRCCFYLEPMNQRSIVRLISDGQPVFTDPKYFRDYGWSLSGTVPLVYMDPSNVTQLNFCLNLQRSSSSLKTELRIPAWSCGILFLFVPIFTNIRIQLITKLFLLLLQFFTLLLFTNRVSPQMGSTANTPTIMQILELGVVLNVISIMCTFCVLALTKLRIYNQPPWDFLINASTLINRFIYIFESASDYQDLEAMELHKEPSADGGPIEQPNSTKKPPLVDNRFRSDWVGCFLAFHAVAIFALSMFFLVGFVFIR
ncbi:hypothetical protein niasHS_007732 [Heterodera schachtii]|uniref:Neurotransmitter-gated ion-channel ligand-binding domain-containing protein n=1 Tax=Heterodera schachtii TaxID=97005 RepID=A0ABD2JPK3_HETSC